MKYIVAIFFALAAAAQASTPTGRFMQDSGAGYRDIQISADGKSATWITKDCSTCHEIRSKPERVKDLKNGWIAIGKTEFQVMSTRALFHPSMGNFGVGTDLSPNRR